MELDRLEENLLVGIGNPLLDISATVEEELLKKYDLQPDGAIMAEEKHMPLYRELMDKYKTEFIAGGSVQNSLRVAQWILKKPNITTYFGCVGNDDYAKILKERAIADGVRVQYQTTDAAPTGTCAVLVNGHASLAVRQPGGRGSSSHPRHLATPPCQATIRAAKFFYASGFFVAVSPESIMQLATHAHAGGHTFIMNLSAAFVSQFYKEPLTQLLPYVDILFGNEAEAEAFGTAFNLGTSDLKEIALKLAEMPKLSQRRRIVVITQGCDPVILVEGGT
ncbi:hypothetical protein ACJJTC_016223 [Scirpophaga incertulas]